MAAVSFAALAALLLLLAAERLELHHGHGRGEGGRRGGKGMLSAFQCCDDDLVAPTDGRTARCEARGRAGAGGPPGLGARLSNYKSLRYGGASGTLGVLFSV